MLVLALLGPATATWPVTIPGGVLRLNARVEQATDSAVTPTA